MDYSVLKPLASFLFWTLLLMALGFLFVALAETVGALKAGGRKKECPACGNKYLGSLGTVLFCTGFSLWFGSAAWFVHCVQPLLK